MTVADGPHPLPLPASSRSWMSRVADHRERSVIEALAGEGIGGLDRRIHELIERNRIVHDRECINLNPASNVMNPRAEAVLAMGLGPRASLGHAGEKYEMGLEAIEEIEVITAALARRVFGARHAEIRVGSGALANLYAFMATCRPGDRIMVPSPEIGGHVTHRAAGAAGLYGLEIHECAVDAANFTVDLDDLARRARDVRPALITIGTSLNLLPHPVREIRQIADEVGARVLFDAAHACGMFAGGVWPSPLAEGAHLMTMSTYKSLGGPAGGLVLADDLELAGRLDAIAYPGLTANFDVGRTTSLAIALLDWLEYGEAYARAMVDTAGALAAALESRDVPVFCAAAGPTTSHQFAFDATGWGGGHETSLRLRDANLLACAIGLPARPDGAGVRFGTPEVVRWGMGASDMPELADLVIDALRSDPSAVATRTSAFRRRFDRLHFVRS